jgi:hypothetical protein
MNDYFQYAGQVANLAAGGTTAVQDVVTDDGTLIEIAYNVDADMGGDCTLTVNLNGSSASKTAVVPDSGAADVGGVVLVSGGGVTVADGDVLTLTADSAVVNATVGEFTYVIRR